MPLTKLTTNVNNIQALSDQPNTVDGLTSSQLKEKFDKAGADIKSYINNTLTEELDDAISSIPSNYVTNDDVRLTNSRTCNNSFDSWSTARTNLKIRYGSTLPRTADDGTIFFLYE